MFSGLRRFLGGSAIFHFTFIVFAVFGAYFAKEPPSHQLKLSEMKELKAVSQKDLIHSIAVSEEELQESLRNYEQMKVSHDSDLRSSRVEVEKTDRKLDMKASQLRKKTEELRTLESKIKKMEQKQRRLAELSTADAKKKRIEERKVAEQKAKKKKLEQERAKEKQRHARLKKQKAANEKALMEIAARNKKAEQRELAIIRGKYESRIHELLYDAWVLPYERQNVHCPVELTLSDSGEIESFTFIGDCPSNYKTYIDLAVERVKRLPHVSKKIFRKKEVINFIDRVD